MLSNSNRPRWTAQEESASGLDQEILKNSNAMPRRHEPKKNWKVVFDRVQSLTIRRLVKMSRKMSRERAKSRYTAMPINTLRLVLLDTATREIFLRAHSQHMRRQAKNLR
jgi:hypothetical protein